MSRRFWTFCAREMEASTGLKYGTTVRRTPVPSYVTGENMYGHDRWRDAAVIMAFLGALLIIGALL